MIIMARAVPASMLPCNPDFMVGLRDILFVFNSNRYRLCPDCCPFFCANSRNKSQGEKKFCQLIFLFYIFGLETRHLALMVRRQGRLYPYWIRGYYWDKWSYRGNRGRKGCRYHFKGHEVERRSSWDSNKAYYVGRSVQVAAGRIRSEPYSLSNRALMH